MLLVFPPDVAASLFEQRAAGLPRIRASVRRGLSIQYSRSGSLSTTPGVFGCPRPLKSYDVLSEVVEKNRIFDRASQWLARIFQEVVRLCFHSGLCPDEGRRVVTEN